MMKRVVLIFVKNLIHGKVKTRLAATAGNDVAFSVYKELLQYTNEITKNIIADKIVFYSNEIEDQDIWSDEIYDKQIQMGNDLGERMQNAFAYAFKKGYNQIVIIGTDCPDLNAALIMDAFAYLNNHDVVIGPAEDGGYYLLGMKTHYTVLFQNIIWSTGDVFDETIAICKNSKISYSLLPVLHDVDEEKDLIHLKKMYEGRRIDFCL